MNMHIHLSLYIYISSDIPQELPELSASPLPGLGPGLSYLLWGCPMVASPHVLTNTFPSPNPQKLDQLASFLLGPKFRASSSPHPIPLLL